MTVCLLILAAAAACGPGDPRSRILEERARWNVQLLDWVQTEDGAINLSTRVSGPPNSTLRQLTVSFLLMDAAENTVARRWHTFDLSQVQRGGPKDILVSVSAAEHKVEGVGVSLVLEPTPEDEPHIVELQP
jgi:hypothetical protein